jgi:hypothetical protein
VRCEGTHTPRTPLGMHLALPPPPPSTHTQPQRTCLTNQQHHTHTHTHTRWQGAAWADMYRKDLEFTAWFDAAVAAAPQGGPKAAAR